MGLNLRDLESPGEWNLEPQESSKHSAGGFHLALFCILPENLSK